ncbi:MAG TPA: hypothetical protein PKY99_08420 [Turneriella sp.]|nr:hypothetical protein [Turneriella sp.]HNL52911.1 hypothetical protein [Turneriella sp.]
MDYTNIDQNFFLKTLPALVANAALVLYALARRPPLWRYLTLFGITTLADISVAGQLVPIASAEMQTGIEYIFVLIGDLRFILLLAYILYAGKTLADINALRLTGDVLRPALIFTLFPTLIVSAIGFAKPELLQLPRHKFLAYELVFFGLTLLWLKVVLPQKPVAEPEQRFIRQVALPVLGFYGLWSLADILILRGMQVGHVVRILPNLLYYCLFLWWVAFAARQKA